MIEVMHFAEARIEKLQQQPRIQSDSHYRTDIGDNTRQQSTSVLVESFQPSSVLVTE